MKAFWWFEENAIAGMARPGFNASHWSQLPLDEGILFGWLGQFSAGPAPLALFRKHLNVYAPKVFPFFKLSQEAGTEALRVFSEPAGILAVANRLGNRTKAFRDFSIDNDQISFQMDAERLTLEINHLKTTGVRRIVCLTEHHHHNEILSGHFNLHHFSTEDLNAPSQEHAFEFAEILRKAKRDGEIVAVHCLAGIGRTSTMLIAAHLVLGEKLEDLRAKVAQRNPTFVLMGGQEDFIRKIAERVRV